jgi:hypothetical protein
VGYILISTEGIPVRFADEMEYKSVLVYTSLVCDFLMRAKRAFHTLFGRSDKTDLESFRIRTKEQKEIIVTTHRDFILAVIQDCRSDKKETTLT